MRKYILAKKGFTWASGLLLARTLRSMGHNYYVTEKPRLATDINWGNSSCITARLNNTIHTDKFKQLEILQEAEIKTINIFRNKGDITSYPVLCRQRNHQAGNDIVVANSEEELVAAYYYSVFEKFSSELRVHVFRNSDRVDTRAFKKVREEEDDLPIRNLANGYEFKLVPLSDECIEFCGKALEALEMDFGTIDVGRKGKGDYTIIEVNSAPSLINNENTLQWFLEKFLQK